MEVLADTGSMVSVEEVRGFMRQALSRGDGLNEAIERCFGGPGPTNASGSEQERFRAAVERLWKREAQTFDPDADAAILAVRDPEELRRLRETISKLQPIIDSAIEDAEAELAGGEQSEPPGRQRGDHE